MAVKFVSQPAVETAVEETKPQSISEWVLQELGTPHNLLRIDAKPLWDNYYRVNVYCAQDVGLSAKEVSVSDSFFVYKTEDGYLSNPEIERKYNHA
jgi:hypothetical protein